MSGDIVIYNENVVKQTSYVTEYDDIVEYDDSDEWYENVGEYRSLAVFVGLISQKSWVRIPLPLLGG